jgi:hypothetical protein
MSRYRDKIWKEMADARKVYSEDIQNIEKEIQENFENENELFFETQGVEKVSPSGKKRNIGFGRNKSPKRSSKAGPFDSIVNEEQSSDQFETNGFGTIYNKALESNKKKLSPSRQPRQGGYQGMFSPGSTGRGSPTRQTSPGKRNNQTPKTRQRAVVALDGRVMSEDEIEKMKKYYERFPNTPNAYPYNHHM